MDLLKNSNKKLKDCTKNLKKKNEEILKSSF